MTENTAAQGQLQAVFIDQVNGSGTPPTGLYAVEKKNSET